MEDSWRNFSSNRVGLQIYFSLYHAIRTYIFRISDIVIAAVDATVASKSASKYGIKGYPTIKFFPKGSSTPTEYDGGRTAPEIIK